MALILNDTFTGTDGSALTAHTSESGHTWIKWDGQAGEGVIKTYSGLSVASAVEGEARIISSAVIGTADVSITFAGTLFPVSGFGPNLLGAFARMTRLYLAGTDGSPNDGYNGYGVFFDAQAGNWRLRRYNALASGNRIVMAELATSTINPMLLSENTTPRTFTFEVTGVGSSVRCLLKEGSTTIIDFSDTSSDRVVAEGKVGIYMGAYNIDNSGRMDSIQASSVSAADTTVPVMTGTLTSNTVTNTAFTIDWSATTRSDNIAITGYETSPDGGTTWIDRGNVTSASYTSLTASTAYTRLVRAYDAAANKSTPALSITVTTAAAADTTVPTMSGSITPSAITSTAFTMSWPAGADNVAVTGYEVSKDGGSTWTNAGNVLTYSYTGLVAATAYSAQVRAYDAANNKSTPALTATITTSAAPVLTSPTGTQTGTTTASGTVSTTVANGTLYRLASINATETATAIKTAALTTTVTATGTQSVTFTGLTASTIYYAHYVHSDAAGSDSVASNSASFTTAAATITYAVAGKNIQGGKRLSVAHHVTVNDKITRALVATKTGLTSDATTGLVSFTHASLVAGTEYMIMPISDIDVKDTGFFWATAT